MASNAPVKPVLYTIGHSNHDWPTFLFLLQQHRITAVADVRSQPTSRLPHFRRAALEHGLRGAGIDYVFLGQELGARREEHKCYEDGCAVYERIAELPAFRSGLERLLNAVQHDRIVLLCAEKEPLDCHRTILVCRKLRDEPIAIAHILADGGVECHRATEKRLLRLKGGGPSLLEPQLGDAALLDRAYAARGRAIAFRKPSGTQSAHAAARLPAS